MAADDRAAATRLMRALAQWLAPSASAQRLALVRILVGAYACVWIAAVTPDLLVRAGLSASRFAPVGLAGLSGMVAPGVVAGALLTTGLLGVAMVLGVGYRGVAPAFAVGLVWLASYRNSWGHLSHGEHLFVLHVLVLALAPAADALRLRPWGRGVQREASPDGRYGWPLQVIMLVTVSTYAIAGLAKLRAGGWAWISGEAVRLHVAHEALRMGLVGEEPSVLARWMLPHAWVFAVAAVGTVVLELGAPLALRRGWVRWGWIGGLWAMHLGIWAVMGIGFAYPLCGVAFVGFLPVERGVDRLRRVIGRLAGR